MSAFVQCERLHTSQNRSFRPSYFCFLRNESCCRHDSDVVMVLMTPSPIVPVAFHQLCKKSSPRRSECHFRRDVTLRHELMKIYRENLTVFRTTAGGFSLVASSLRRDISLVATLQPVVCVVLLFLSSIAAAAAVVEVVVDDAHNLIWNITYFVTATATRPR